MDFPPFAPLHDRDIDVRFGGPAIQGSLAGAKRPAKSLHERHGHHRVYLCQPPFCKGIKPILAFAVLTGPLPALICQIALALHLPTALTTLSKYLSQCASYPSISSFLVLTCSLVFRECPWHTRQSPKPQCFTSCHHGQLLPMHHLPVSSEHFSTHVAEVHRRDDLVSTLLGILQSILGSLGLLVSAVQSIQALIDQAQTAGLLIPLPANLSLGAVEAASVDSSFFSLTVQASSTASLSAASSSPSEASAAAAEDERADMHPGRGRHIHRCQTAPASAPSSSGFGACFIDQRFRPVAFLSPFVITPVVTIPTIPSIAAHPYKIPRRLPPGPRHI
ncbi:hypothetical protein EDB19DRAFT_2033205 [Suillus lakei]|nr:hypothetical protein EDB19DRAFT_2033205 [Suillus lakei]